MKRPTGWERRLLITIFIIPFLFFMTQIPAVAFGPVIVDVTTKAFSVLWTTGGSYESCDIKLYTDDSYTTLNADIGRDHIVIETDPNFRGKYPGEDGVQYGIVKVTVVGLSVGKTYYCKPFQNGAPLSGLEVTTERLRGFDLDDPNMSDIVSNPIIHRTVYKSNAVSPAIGALVLADIYPYNADLASDPPLSDYPITAWVGDGMIGDENDNAYNPNDISYKQYAALNMNNLYSKVDHYSLSLEGDNPATTPNESEIIKFTIVHGTQSVLGGTSSGFYTSQGRLEYIEKAGDEKITAAKISASFKFARGVNVFTLPFIISDGYTTGELLLDIEEAEGKENIVPSIYIFRDEEWKRTYASFNIFTGQRIIRFPYPLQAGQGCYIIMKEGMTNEITFYGKPNSVLLDLKPGVNLVTIPQLPAYYTTENLLKDIESKNGTPESVKSIYSFIQEEWKRTYSSINIFTGQKIVRFPYPMTNTKFNYILIKPGTPSIEDWDPFNK